LGGIDEVLVLGEARLGKRILRSLQCGTFTHQGDLGAFEISGILLGEFFGQVVLGTL
jgi:hypothetical protein